MYFIILFKTKSFHAQTFCSLNHQVFFKYHDYITMIIDIEYYVILNLFVSSYSRKKCSLLLFLNLFATV